MTIRLEPAVSALLYYTNIITSSWHNATELGLEL